MDHPPDPLPAADPPLPALQPLRRRLVLDVEIGVEPLTGVLHADGVEHIFAGWMGLASVLGRVIG